MYNMKRGEEKTVVFSDAAMMRHLEAGWELDESEDKEVPATPVIAAVADEPKKRGPKPKNKETD